MSKFILTSVNHDVVTTKEFETEYLFDVVERFEEFLRGCGYHFRGTLDFVEEDVNIDDYDFNQYDLLGKFSFNKNPNINPDGC